MEGNTCADYIIGLTTFYSFPTPVKPDSKEKTKRPMSYKFGNVEGVEKLFKAILNRIQKMEYERLNSYEFAENAVWIFTQLSSYRYVKGFQRFDYWPLRRTGSVDLKKILQMP
jgi:hypothetical protein